MSHSAERDTLTSVAFRREREASWRELEVLLKDLDRKGVRRIDPERLYRLPSLYRSALSSLSIAREISLDRNLVEYLEALAKRAYIQVYSADREYFGALLTFFLRTFPRQVWRSRGYVALSILLLAVGVFAGYQLTSGDVEQYFVFLPGELERTPLSSREELLEVLETESTEGLSSFASFLFANNAGVTLNAFVTGLGAGVPTALLLFYNGVTLGSFVALHNEKGLTFEVLAWLAPHGITELLAICLGGAGGLILASSLLFPGPLRRIESFAVRGRDATVLLAGALAMIAVAAIIEGYFRQLVTSNSWRVVVAVVSIVVWGAYFGWWGRRSTRGAL